MQDKASGAERDRGGIKQAGVAAVEVAAAATPTTAAAAATAAPAPVAATTQQHQQLEEGSPSIAPLHQRVAVEAKAATAAAAPAAAARAVAATASSATASSATAAAITTAATTTASAAAPAAAAAGYRVYSVDVQPNNNSEQQQQQQQQQQQYRVATAGADEFVHLWSLDFSSGSLVVTCISRLVGHEKEVNCVRWNPEGSLLATGGSGESIFGYHAVFLWVRSHKPDSVPLGVDASVLQYHEWWSRTSSLRRADAINSLAWSPSGNQLAIGSEDGRIFVCDVTDGFLELGYCLLFMQVFWVRRVVVCWRAILIWFRGLPLILLENLWLRKAAIRRTQAHGAAAASAAAQQLQQQHQQQQQPHAVPGQAVAASDTSSSSGSSSSSSSSSSGAANTSIAAAAGRASMWRCEAVIKCWAKPGATTREGEAIQEDKEGDQQQQQHQQQQQGGGGSGVRSSGALRQLFLAENQLPSFFRRLDWSPDGSLLVTPGGAQQHIFAADGEACQDSNHGPMGDISPQSAEANALSGSCCVHQSSSTTNSTNSINSSNNNSSSNGSSSSSSSSSGGGESFFAAYAFHRRLLQQSTSPFVTHRLGGSPSVCVRFNPCFFAPLPSPPFLSRKSTAVAEPTAAATATTAAATAATAPAAATATAAATASGADVVAEQYAKTNSWLFRPEDRQHMLPLRTSKQQQQQQQQQQEEVGDGGEMLEDTAERIPRGAQDSDVCCSTASSAPSEDLVFPRFIYCICTLDGSVLIYDTQFLCRPLATLHRLHLAPMTDCSWSSDGRLLVCSSSDGYLTFVLFKETELGQTLEPPKAIKPQAFMKLPIKGGQQEQRGEAMRGGEAAAGSVKPRLLVLGNARAKILKENDASAGSNADGKAPPANLHSAADAAAGHSSGQASSEMHEGEVTLDN
ncbi:hypothetical protein ACSSS7_003826 [Eimeria intestinalis]